MNKSTSWEKSHRWYGKVVGEQGHFYHQNIIIPHLLDLLKLKNGKASLLDLGCGQGILSRILPKGFDYCGIDISLSLIKEAKKRSKNKDHTFITCDIITEDYLIKEKFDYVSFILSIQNMNDQKKAIYNAAKTLKPDGMLIIVMNHPCFRIPRQSSWAVDENKKMQYRRIDSYMSSMEIPIQIHPSKNKRSEVLFSFHFPLSTYANWLHASGFFIENIHELCSTKKSTGAKAKMENRARKEIPLFMSIVAKKIPV